MSARRPNHAELGSVLTRVGTGDAEAAGELAPLVYDELRRLAHQYLRDRARGPVMQTTALVNEAYIRLLGREPSEWESRAHFFAVGARAMRQILASEARARLAQKRGGSWERLTLADVGEDPGDPADVLAIDDAIGRLAQLDERQARVVELRFFGGMTVREIAHVLSISVSSVEREWRTARAWLVTELGGGSA